MILVLETRCHNLFVSFYCVRDDEKKTEKFLQITAGAARSFLLFISLSFILPLCVCNVVMSRNLRMDVLSSSQLQSSSRAIMALRDVEIEEGRIFCSLKMRRNEAAVWYFFRVGAHVVLLSLQLLDFNVESWRYCRQYKKTRLYVTEPLHLCYFIFEESV